MRDIRERLRDILEAIERMERHALKGRKAFDEDELIQTWMVHHLEIIGEAATKLGRDFHERYTQVPWPQITAMRNTLVHEYFGIDLDEVWATLEHDLPVLKHQIETILNDLDYPPEKSNSN